MTCASMQLATEPPPHSPGDAEQAEQDEQLRAVEAAELQFAESLELDVVLAQIAQQVARLFGGVCQVRFAPAHRPLDARREVAGPDEPPAAPGAQAGGKSYAALLERIDDRAGGRGALRCYKARARRERREGHNGGRSRSPGGALLAAPLVARGRRLGTIDLVLPALDEPTLLCSQERLQMLAAHAALAIDTADRFARSRPAADAGGPSDSREMSQLLAMIVHDLRNPLTALSSSIQLLARMTGGAQELEPARVARLAEVAEAAVSQLEAQINGLAPLAGALAHGEQPAAHVDLVRLARLMADVYQQTTARHHLIVRATVPALRGPWSRPHLERVLGNLLTNAIKYSPDGGAVHVLIGYEHDERGGWATLRVQNQGIGIPLADLPQIAQPGYRGQNVGAIPGTGLGLASVREVVERYGGTFAMQSEIGATTTALIRLPLG